MRLAAPTRRNDSYNGPEIQVVDFKTIHCDQPGMRMIAMQNNLAPET